MMRALERNNKSDSRQIGSQSLPERSITSTCTQGQNPSHSPCRFLVSSFIVSMIPQQRAQPQWSSPGREVQERPNPPGSCLSYLRSQGRARMLSPAVTNTEALEKGPEPGQHTAVAPQVTLTDKLKPVDFMNWTWSL